MKGVAVFGFEKLLLKATKRKYSIKGKAFRSALGYTQIYWQDIPQLLENYTLGFYVRRKKVYTTNRVWLEQR